jgi:hypothetical protein
MLFSDYHADYQHIPAIAAISVISNLIEKVIKILKKTNKQQNMNDATTAHAQQAHIGIQQIM